MEILNIKILKDIDGKSVFRKKESDLAFSESWITNSNKIFCFSIRSNKHKYIYTKPLDTKEITEKLYDIKKDPQEKNNISKENKEVINIMRKAKENYLKN